MREPIREGSAPSTWRPLVSTIIPARNVERFVAQAVGSAVAQTYAATEIIVVDYGGSDATAAVLAVFEDRIRLIHPQSHGLSAARNAGIRASSGNLVAFLDADDMWLPHKLQRQVEAFTEEPSCAMVSGEVYAIDEEGRRVGHWKKSSLGRRVSDTFGDLYEGNYIHASTVVVRRECLEAVGGFREDLDTTEDYDLWLRLAQRYPIRYLDEPLAGYRLHGGQFTQDVSKFERRIQNNIRVLTQPPLATGKSWLEKRIRTAKVYLQYARLYKRHGRHRQAAATFLKSLRTWPFVRPALWPFWPAPGARDRFLAGSMRGGAAAGRRAMRIAIGLLGRLVGLEISVRRRRAPKLPTGKSAGRRRICILVPALGLASETFIQNHIRELPAEVIVLQGIYPRLRLSDDRPVADLPRFLTRNHVDVVLAEHGQTAASVAAACRQARTPLVAHFHGRDAFDTEVVRAYRHRYSEMFSIAARVVVVSASMRSQLEALGCDPGKIRRVPCGVSLERFAAIRPSRNPPVVCAVGRFVAKKAPHLALMAFTEVRNTVPEARLLMMGDGPLLEPCRMLARALGVDPAVTFTGPVTHEEVAAGLRHARVFVQHSVVTASGDREGLPSSILEACATGLPVVATRHAGITEVISDGVNGLLVEELDVPAMSERLVRLLADPLLADRLGQAARVRVEQDFSLASTIRDLASAIEEAIAS